MTIHNYLHNIHPAAPGLALMLALWASAYIVRRYLPKLWAPLTRWPDPEHPIAHMIQALPTTAAGAAFAGFQLGGLDGALYGAVSGAGAPVFHHVIKHLPGPYRGTLNDAAKRWLDAQKSAGLLIFLGLFLGGCADHKPPRFAEMFNGVALTACEWFAVVQADKRAVRECPENQKWESCPKSAQIEADLASDLKDCE